MASSLNPPSHFKKNSSVLLPPSSFESPQPGVDPWRALAQATGEILDLKQQNTKLKETTHVTFPVGEEIKARVDLHQHPPTQAFTITSPHPPHLDHTQLSHYHELINRQAEELSLLRKQLGQTTSDYDKQVAKLENQLVLKDSNHAYKMAALEDTLRNVSEKYEEQKSKFTVAHAKWDTDQQQTNCQWRDKLELNERQQQEEITGLRTQLQDMEYHMETRQAEVTSKLSEYQNTIDNQMQTISKMKTYLSENEELTKSTEIWRTEIDNIKQKLIEKENEKSKLESEVDLLRIRLKSQNEILTIQEKVLSKVKDGNTEKKKQCLLTRWREKVYELLVQLKCAEISQQDCDTQWKNKLYNIENTSESLENQCQVLQHTLQDRQAELSMEKNTTRTLEQELMKAQQVAINLDDKANLDREMINQLVQSVHRFSETATILDTSHADVLSILSSHNQRLAYASGRVELLQGQFARKEAHLRLELEDKLIHKPTKDTNTDPDLPVHRVNQLQSELDRVTEERDSLAAQIKSDARLLEKKVLVAKEQVADDVCMLKQRLEELHSQLDSKSQECEELNNQLEKVRTDQEEALENVESLKIQLVKSQLQTEKDLESARITDQSQFTEQLAGMEQKLNEARREHTKAVVSLRQLERQVTRDKERHSQQLQNSEQFYKSELVKIENKWRAAEKDKNLLMATLRQEGLVGKYKSQRRSPAFLSDDMVQGGGPQQTEIPSTRIQTQQNTSRSDQSLRPDEPPTRDTDPSGDEERTPYQPSVSFLTSSLDAQEPLHVVIDDLKSLTQAVLEDEDDDDDGEDTEEEEEHSEHDDIHVTHSTFQTTVTEHSVQNDASEDEYS